MVDEVTSKEQRQQAKEVVKTFVKEMVKGRKMNVMTQTGQLKTCVVSLSRKLDTLKIKVGSQTRSIALRDIDEIAAGADVEGPWGRRRGGCVGRSRIGRGGEELQRAHRELPSTMMTMNFSIRCFQNSSTTPRTGGDHTGVSAKQWQEALKLFEAIPKGQVQPSVISYNAAISACEKGWQWQHALKLFEAVPKAQVQPSVISYNAAISACEKGWQWQQALKLFWAIPKTKGRPNVISYSAAISSCEKGGQWQEALELFEDMPKSKVQPDVISYGAAISACEKGGQWQEALKLFETIPKAKVHQNVISYNAAISACEKGGQWQQALLLFETMPHAKVQPDVITYNAAISACEKGGQSQEALKLFKAMGMTKVQQQQQHLQREDDEMLSRHDALRRRRRPHDESELQTRLERQMHGLKKGLQQLRPAERRQALEQLSPAARQALLRFMTKDCLEQIRWSRDLFALPKRCSPRERGGEPCVTRPVRLRGVRRVPTGLFQASISFANLLVRSRTAKSADAALRFHGALRRFRELSVGGDANGGDARATARCAALRLEGERLQEALAVACGEAGLQEEDLRPSYSATLRTVWARVESPTTSSLTKALVWLQRLRAAKGSSVALKRVLAEARVDRARHPKGRRQERYKALRAQLKVAVALQNFQRLLNRIRPEVSGCPEQEMRPSELGCPLSPMFRAYTAAQPWARMGQCHVVPCYSLMESSYDVNYLIRGHDGDHAGAGAFGEGCRDRDRHLDRDGRGFVFFDCGSWTLEEPTEVVTALQRRSQRQVLSCRFTSSGEVSELQWTLQEQLDEFRRGAPLDEMAPEPPAEVLQGTLMACTHRASHASRCVKTIPKKDCWTRGYVLEEIELLEMVSGKHPNIVRFFEFFEEWDCLHLIFEFCPRGSLDQVIHSSSFQAGGDELVAKLVCQVASALDFLKELAIVHRDVKPGNLLFEEDQVKLADFGCACLAPEPLEEPMGTPIFWAPEVHQLPRGKGYHFPVDMWALGICFYMMLYQGVHPFLQKGFLRRKDVQSGTFDASWFTSWYAKDLLEWMLMPHPAQRLCPNEVPEHPWCSSFGLGKSSFARTVRRKIILDSHGNWI
eukprot:g24333.t2